MKGRVINVMRGIRKPLTSKDGNKHYYKGKGSGPMGLHTKYGAYVIDPQKIREFVVPKFENPCLLKAYVSQKTKKMSQLPLTANSFLFPSTIATNSDNGAALSSNLPVVPPFPYSQVKSDAKSPLYLRLIENISKIENTYKKGKGIKSNILLKQNS